MKYGGILKACRERANLNQEELAFKIHVTQSDISKFETNAKEPSISVLRAWVQQTQSQEVMVAFICGVDGIGMMQQVMDLFSSTTVGLILGGIM